MTVRDGGLRGTIIRGASWTTLGQFVPVAVNVALTPVLIAYLGLERYGLYVLANTIVIFLNSFDGGIGASMSRFSSVYAGTNDRAAATRLVTSMTLVVTAVATLLFCMMFFLAGSILAFFNASASLLSQGRYLLTSLAVVLALAQFRSLFAAQLTARQLYAWQSLVSISSYAVFAAGVVVTIRFDAGLVGLARTFLAQAGLQFVLVAGRTIGYFELRAVKFMPRSELGAFLKFASRVQATSLTTIVSQQADAFITGKFLSVGAVGLYGAGANFANQLRGVLFNVLGPMSTAIAQAYGRGGDDEAIALFTRLQERWVDVSTAWSAVGVGAVYFGVQAWLGPDFRLAAVVAAVLTAAYAVHMWTGTLTALLTAVGRPEIEVRYAYIAAGSNIILTVPLLYLMGLVGVVVATGLSLILASVLYIRIARRRFCSTLPSFFSVVPWLPAAWTTISVVVAELLVHPLVPTGAFGLVLCGAVAAPGFAVFAVARLGPRRLLYVCRQVVHDRAEKLVTYKRSQ